MLQQARAAGVSFDALRRKSWRRIGTQLSCWRGLAEDPWCVLAAWWSRLPKDATFAGLPAAWLYRLVVDPRQTIEVIVPPKSSVRSRRNLIVRRCMLRDVALVRGLRVTTLARTFQDRRRLLTPVELLVVADQALRLAYGRYHDDAEPAESPMETRLRWLLVGAGLAKPEVQVDLRDSDGRFVGRADLFYRSCRLVMEYDGVNRRERLVDDNRPQDLLVNAGFACSASPRPGTRFARFRLAADPAEELLDLDPVEAPHEGVVAEAQHREPVAVQLLPLARRGIVSVDRAEFELNPEGVQQVDHRAALMGVVRAVQDRLSVAHRDQ
jgi:hypothetical protein